MGRVRPAFRSRKCRHHYRRYQKNTEAPIIVGTTENTAAIQLYDAMHQGYDLNCDLVILDEAHFLGDMIARCLGRSNDLSAGARQLLLLSATIGNGEEIARWLESIRKEALHCDQ